MRSKEYQQLKEAEKEHLRALRRLKEAVRLLRRRRAVDEALGRIERQAEEVWTRHDEALERLALETAYQEARLELALEGQGLPSDEALDAAQARRRAQELLQQLREHPDAAAASGPPVPPEASSEKTLGRLRPPRS